MKFEFYNLEEALGIWCDSELLLDTYKYSDETVFGIYRDEYENIVNGKYLFIEFCSHRDVLCVCLKYNEDVEYFVPIAFIKNIILEKSDSEGMILEAINYM